MTFHTAFVIIWMSIIVWLGRSKRKAEKGSSNRIVHPASQIFYGSVERNKMICLLQYKLQSIDGLIYLFVCEGVDVIPLASVHTVLLGEFGGNLWSEAGD